MEPYCKENEYLHRKVQEKGIHVGSLPSAAVVVLGRGGLPRVGVSVRGCLPGGMSAQGGGDLPRGCLLRGVFPVGVSTQWRGCLPSGGDAYPVEGVSTQWRGVCLVGVCPPNPEADSPPCGQNDRRL